MSNPRYEDNIERLVNAHADISNAILQKGGTVTRGDGFENFADDIRSIPQEGGGIVQSRNFVKVTATEASTQYGITFTPDPFSGIIDIDGSCTSTDADSISFTVVSGTWKLPDGTYKLYVYPVTTSSTVSPTDGLYCGYSVYTSGVGTGDSAAVDMTQSYTMIDDDIGFTSSNDGISIQLTIKSSTAVTFNHAKIKIMLMDDADTSTDYEPYTLNNLELTEYGNQIDDESVKAVKVGSNAAVTPDTNGVVSLSGLASGIKINSQTNAFTPDANGIVTLSADTSISSNSTNNTIPTSKAVYDAIPSVNVDRVTDVTYDANNAKFVVTKVTSGSSSTSDIQVKTSMTYNDESKYPPTAEAVAYCMRNNIDDIIYNEDLVDYNRIQTRKFSSGNYDTLIAVDSVAPTDSNSRLVTSRVVYNIKHNQEIGINSLADQGVKNQLRIQSSTNTVNNCVYTHDSTNSIVTVTTTSSSHVQSEHILATLGEEWYGKEITLSGCPAGGVYSPLASRTYALYISKISDSNTVMYDVGSGKTGTLPNEDCQVAIVIGANYSISGSLEFKPMIRSAGIADDTFEPYAMSNRQLTDNLKIISDQGVKNYLNVTGTTTGSNPKFTVNANGTITVYASSSHSESSFVVGSIAGSKFGNKTLYVSGCPSGGSDSGYSLRVVWDSTTHAVDTGAGAEFNIPADKTCYITIKVSANTPVSNLVFSPMVQFAAIADQTFVKYAKTNTELTDDVSTLTTSVSGKADASSVVTSARITSSGTAFSPASGTLTIPASTSISSSSSDNVTIPTTKAVWNCVTGRGYVTSTTLNNTLEYYAELAMFKTVIFKVNLSSLTWTYYPRLGMSYSNFTSLWGSQIAQYFEQVLSVSLGNFGVGSSVPTTANEGTIIPAARVANNGTGLDSSGMINLYRTGSSTTAYPSNLHIYLYVFGIAPGYSTINPGSTPVVLS